MDQVFIENFLADGNKILKFSPDGIFMIDFDMKIVYVNPSFCKMLGYTAEEVIGTSITDHLGDLSILANCMQSVQDTGSCNDQETIFRRKDGSMVHISKNVQAMMDDNGEMIGIVVFIRDMTNLQLLNNKLLASEEELEVHVKNLEETLQTLQETQDQLVENEKMASLGNLVAGVAHEVNTPLGISITASTHFHDVLKTITEAFESKSITTSQLDTALKTFNEIDVILSKNLFRAAELIGSFKKVAVNQTDDLLEEFYLCECLRDVYNSTHHTVKLHRAEFSIECGKEIQVRSYSGVIAQILTNLIMNSLLHGFNESIPAPKISITAKIEDQSILLTYTDNGKGMDEVTQQKAFEPFYTTARGKGGSGLGLHIVHSLAVQKLKGSIKLTSSPGNGCTVTLKFPKILG